MEIEGLIRLDIIDSKNLIQTRTQLPICWWKCFKSGANYSPAISAEEVSVINDVDIQLRIN